MAHDKEHTHGGAAAIQKCFRSTPRIYPRSHPMANYMFEYVHQVAFLDRDKTAARPCWLHGFGQAQCAQHGAPGFNGRQRTVLHNVNEKKLATDRQTDEHSPSRTQDGMLRPSTTISKVSTKSPATSHSLSSRAPPNQCFTQQV